MANSQRFTDKFIMNLKPQEKEFWVREGMGFSLRVLPSGEKIWYYIFTFDGRKRYLRLGAGGYPEVSLGDARLMFDIAKVKVKNGVDPLTEQDQRREERRASPTMSELVPDYLERHAKRFKRSWAEDERILNSEVITHWKHRKAGDIKKRDVIELLEGIVNRGSPAMANNAFQVVRKMFNWAVEKDILPFTPCTGLKLPSPKVSRDRVLKAAEIKAFWENLDDCAMSEDARRALKLILVTAQRPGEVAGIHTREIDGRWWTLPQGRSKNTRAQRIYLTDLALEIIGDTDGKGYIFPSPHKAKDRSIDDHSLSVAVNRSLSTALLDHNGKPLCNGDGKPSRRSRIGIDQFTPHDLRRTAATFMAEMGIMDEVIDAVLNHAKQGVIKVYNQYRYDKEKQAALEAWDRKLHSIIAGEATGKVISLRRNRDEG